MSKDYIILKEFWKIYDTEGLKKAIEFIEINKYNQNSNDISNLIESLKTISL